MTRGILIDDTDPGITYTGTWFADRGSLDDLGTSGAPYLSTLHGTATDASFSYTFQGNTVFISGTQQYENSSAVTNPSWECFVDNIVTAINFTYSSASNRLELCAQGELTDGAHTVTVNAHVTGGRTFWFDSLAYAPSASVSLDNAAIFVGVPDDQMSFGTGWAAVSSGYKTSTEGSTFSFKFNGLSLTWFGFYDAQSPFAAATGTYAIDLAPPTTFHLNGMTATTAAGQSNQIFFKTPTLPAGTHTLEVVYQGNNSTTPLTIQYLVVQNGTAKSTMSSESLLAAASTSSVSFASTTFASASGSLLAVASASGVSSAFATSSGNFSPKNQNSNSSHSKSRVGVIVGAASGALAIITTVVVLILFLRRRETCSRQKLVVQDGKAIIFRPIVPSSVGDTIPYTSMASSSSPGNHFLGNPVVGKRNLKRTTSPTGQVDQYSKAPPTSKAKLISTMIPQSTVAPTPVRNKRSNLTSATHPEPAAGSPAAPASTTGGTVEIYSAQFIRDEDSGIRMRQANEGELVVLPPAYTAT